MNVDINLQPVLEGRLVKLRPLHPSDFDSLYTVAADPLIWEQHPQRNRYQKDVFQIFFNNAIESRGALLALDIKTGKAIGSSRYYDYDAAQGCIAVGYSFLSREYWGYSYNNEMKKLMLDHAFRFVKRVLFHIGENNIRSQKSIEKIGAYRAGSMDREHPDGTKNHTLVYQVDKDTYTL